MLDASRHHTVYYKLVLQTERNKKKEKKLYGNSKRKFREDSGSHKDAGQTNQLQTLDELQHFLSLLSKSETQDTI